MILIIGSHADDVLYVTSLLNGREDELYLGRFPSAKGTIFNQEVMTISGIHTALLASAVTSRILSSHYVSVVFVLGKCFTVDRSYKQGDILISKEIYDIDVDQIDVANVSLGQVPGFQPVYRVQKDIVGYLQSGFSRRTLAIPTVATFLSTDNLGGQGIERVITSHSFLGHSGGFAVDSVSFGIALSSMLYDVPMVSVKAVERRLGQTKSVETYLSALNSYVDIGKAVVYTIGDIGRSDVLQVRRGE